MLYTDILEPTAIRIFYTDILQPQAGKAVKEAAIGIFYTDILQPAAIPIFDTGILQPWARKLAHTYPILCLAIFKELYHLDQQE